MLRKIAVVVFLLWCGCASNRIDVRFVDSDALPDTDTVQVCIVREKRLDCMGVDNFMRLYKSKQPTPVTSEL